MKPSWTGGAQLPTWLGQAPTGPRALSSGDAAYDSLMAELGHPGASFDGKLGPGQHTYPPVESNPAGAGPNRADPGYDALMQQLGHPGWTFDGTRGPGQPTAIARKSPRSGPRSAAQARPGVSSRPRRPPPLASKVNARIGESPLDTPFRFGRDWTTARDLFASFRAGGISPHGLGADGDEQAARGLVDASARKTRGGESSAKNFGAGTEESVAANPFFGVTEGAYPGASDPCVSTYGDYDDILTDNSEMGAGRVRRLKKSDLYWGSLFPLDQDAVDSFQDGQKIPPPGDLQTNMRADGYACLGQFTDMLRRAIALKMKVNVMPFNAGGGATLTSGDHDPDTGVGDSTFALIAAGAPPHQNGVIVSSTEGWDEFYWDSTRSDWPTSARVERPRKQRHQRTNEETFQKYALNVWPTDEQVVGPGYVSPYMMECARRKSLAIAAYADVLAEYFVKLQTQLKFSGVNLQDVLDVVELGNELQANFQDLKDLGTPVSEEYSHFGGMEAGRYFALIAGPIRHQLSWMQFRVSEIASVAGKTAFESRCAWLYDCITTGMAAELTLWDLKQGRRDRDYLWSPHALSVALAEWSATATAAGFVWPPSDRTVALTVGEIVHQIGFHWFNAFDSAGADLKKRPELYRTDVALYEQYNYMHLHVVEPLASPPVWPEPFADAPGAPAPPRGDGHHPRRCAGLSRHCPDQKVCGQWPLFQGCKRGVAGRDGRPGARPAPLPRCGERGLLHLSFEPRESEVADRVEPTSRHGAAQRHHNRHGPVRARRLGLSPPDLVRGPAVGVAGLAILGRRGVVRRAWGDRAPVHRPLRIWYVRQVLEISHHRVGGSVCHEREGSVR